MFGSSSGDFKAAGEKEAKETNSFLRRINELQKKRFSCKFRKITVESHLRHKAHSPQDALDTLTFWIGLIFPATSNRSRGGLACIQENSQYIPAHPKHTSGEWKKNEKSIQVSKSQKLTPKNASLQAFLSSNAVHGPSRALYSLVYSRSGKQQHSHRQKRSEGSTRSRCKALRTSSLRAMPS